MHTHLTPGLELTHSVDLGVQGSLSQERRKEEREAVLFHTLALTLPLGAFPPFVLRLVSAGDLFWVLLGVAGDGGKVSEIGSHSEAQDDLQFVTPLP